MKERLTVLLHHLGMTASRFADEIGVQRSGISHILSGRNQPGYDFMVKTLHKFPEINIEWLLTGKGKMFKTEQEQSQNQNQNQNQHPTDLTRSTPDTDRTKNPVANKEVTSVNFIQRIIVCYTDGTFDHYNPAGKD
jgi:transcriptional regulator with XRE-family HTH domain